MGRSEWEVGNERSSEVCIQVLHTSRQACTSHCVAMYETYCQQSLMLSVPCPTQESSVYRKCSQYVGCVHTRPTSTPHMPSMHCISSVELRCVAVWNTCGIKQPPKERMTVESTVSGAQQHTLPHMHAQTNRCTHKRAHSDSRILTHTQGVLRIHVD